MTNSKDLYNIAKIWLNAIIYLEKHTTEIAVTDMCLQHFDDCYLSSKFDYLDKILEIIEMDKHSLDLLIGVLTWSRLGKEYLSNRQNYVDRLITYLHETGQYEEGLVVGLL